ncbi:tyrosine-type recombinase/integrase [Eleftheria terrae]|uniref:tyrosine-type recombinase/integrase n=1 Tax=Eleftheria terrae TaxID=1597781 RepID=UPI00263B5BDD|nr:tyrosine-type recombinase/integrase [Eleftheria terrae]WKB55973.1 tyrosine-type recombinase/integrase [Eleftheria terrae]
MPPIPIKYTKQRGHKLYLNLPIPKHLRGHFLTATGKPQSYIVEALGTGDAREAAKLVQLRRAHWLLEFDLLSQAKAAGKKVEPVAWRATELREAMAEALEKEDSDGADVIESVAADLAEEVEAKHGHLVAQQFYQTATQPDRLTLKAAQAELHSSKDLKEQTKLKREHALGELLAFLKVPDCLPECVTDARAVAYVDFLNRSDLGHSTKQDRLSSLQTLWRYLHSKRQVPRGVNPWTDHRLTGKRRNAEGGDAEKRGWKEAEILKLYGPAPDGPKGGPQHYTRSLFLELYTLGFLTGMRLDEICSLKREDLEHFGSTDGGHEQGYWITIRNAKTEAGQRTIPIVHRAAVAVLKRRHEHAKEGGFLFGECRPGGPDNKRSWHVQKALGRYRDKLGFGSEVDFHSTRRSFMTMMDNEAADMVVHVQRYVGHRVPTMMHAVYSDGPSRENFLRVARAARYGAKTEEALGAATQYMTVRDALHDAVGAP